MRIHKLRKSKEDHVKELQLIRSMAGSGSIIIWIINNKKVVTYFNQAFTSTLADIDGSDEMVWFSDGTLDTYAAKNLWRVLYEQVFAGKSCQEIVKLQNGQWLKVWLVPIYGSNEVVAASGWGIDITEEMAARASLTKSELKFRNIFESLQDVFFRCRIDGELVMVSPSVTKIAGYSSKELLGKDITNYYLYSVTTKGMFRQLTRRKELKNIEISVIHRSGKIIPSLCSLKLVSEGNENYIEGTMRDIAELKQTNEELEYAIEMAEGSLQVKEKFLANMSHEIRTPLNGIIGMINVLEKTPLSEEQNDQVQALKQSSDILLKLLNNLLDWSKLGAGKMTVNLAPLSMREVVGKVVLIYEKKALENKVSMSYKIDEKIPEYILSDEVKLLQILSNLISNAIKFTREGGSVEIVLKLESLTDDKVKLKCQVRDTGIGIREDEKNRLFSSFTQLDSSENKKHHGAGLGLSISKELVHLLGGEIDVESIPDQGSIFWFTFKSAVAEQKQAKISKVVRVEKFEFAPKVLIVDDNKINLDVAAGILKNAGATVYKARSGEEALKMLGNENFSVVLLDIQMPGMSGIDVINKMDEQFSDIPPVIALTAYSSEGEKQKFLALGFNDFLSKPIVPDEMINKVKLWSTVHEKIIDENIQKKLISYGGTAMLEEAMNDFYVETEKQIKECFVSLSNNNHKRILDILHTIKGNAGTLGVNKVARCARQIEEQLKKGYISRLQEELKELDYFFNEFKTHYLPNE